MKFKTQTAELIRALSAVTRALPPRTARPILEGILVRTGDGSVTLTASDGSLTIRAEAGAWVDEPGAAVLPGKMLSDIARKLPGNDADFSTLGNRVTVHSGRSRTTLTAMDAADYPEAVTFDGGHALTLGAATVREMVGSVSFSAATDQSRIALTGLRLTVKDGRTELAALDGFRLAVARADGGDGAFGALIPSRTAGELARILPQDDTPCAMRFTDGHMLAECGGISVSSVLLNAEFPDYARIVPQGFATDCLASKEAMQSAIDRAGLVAMDAHNNLVRMEVGKNGITVTGRSETGEVVETVDAQTAGPELTISFNAKYMADIFRALDSDRVRLRFNSQVQPCVMEPDGGGGATYLVLPVRTA